MLAHLLAAAAPPFEAPTLDWHALAPELVLTATFVVVLLVDLFTDQHQKWLTSSITGIGRSSSRLSPTP